MAATKENWLSLKQAAERLGIHPITLRRWADNGELPTLLTPGGHRRFAVADLDRFAEPALDAAADDEAVDQNFDVVVATSIELDVVLE